MLIKKPFVNYTIGEKDPIDSGRILTVRLSPEEYRVLLNGMITLNVSRDSTALKEFAFIGINVLQALFSPASLKWLTDGTRRINESKISKLKARLGENVTQKNGVM